MKNWLVVVLVIVVGLGVILAVIAGIGALRRATASSSTPVVDINSPGPNDQLLSEQPVMLQAVARDPDGVVRIEFWLDGKLLDVENSPWKDGITPLPFARSTHIKQVGPHGLVVRAVDRLGNTGQSSLLLSVVQGPDPVAAKPYVIQQGDTLDGLAEAMGVPVEDITALNPGLSGSLPPAGEVITLPVPATELPEDGRPPAEEHETPIDVPDLLPTPAPDYPRWLDSVHGIVDPVSFPVGRLEMALLEVDDAYDGVFCYVSAGDSPVLRIPGDGFLRHLSGNFWDIAEWFSGERMLPFISSRGTIRLRMNCVGYFSTTGGGIVYDLGTLDYEEAITEPGSGFISRGTEGAAHWFHVQFRVQPLGGESGVPGAEYVLYLDSSRYARGEISLVPDPHVILEFRIYDGSRHIDPPVMDGFLIYRNGALWRTTGPMSERYVVWDHLLEAGGCGQEAEFFVVGYKGNPLAPTVSLRSNLILVSGYCPLEEQLKLVTFQFNWLKVICLDGIERSGLVTFGTGPICGGRDQPECDPVEILIGGCPSALDNFGPVSYGGLLVNGHTVIDMPGVIQFTPRLYDFRLPPWDASNHYVTILEAGESLTVSSSLWDYDVWSADDSICPGSYTFYPADLNEIVRSGGSKIKQMKWFGGDSLCAVEFKFSVEPFYAPPPTIVP